MATSINQFIKLIRWPNLVMLMLSMSIILFFVIVPGLDIKVFVDGMSFGEFALLVMSTVFIAIGGYIINDVFDIHCDAVNKLEVNSPVGNSISVETANTLYWIFTILGVLMGVLLSYLVKQTNFSLIFLLSAGLLWFYSQKYQCQPLIGNIVVSFLSALSFGLVWIFEFYALSNNANVFVSVQPDFHIINRLIIIYTGFAFMLSMMREVIKDIEDYKGDDRFGCITFAVKFGIKASINFALVLTYTSLIAGIFVVYIFYMANYFLLFTSFTIIDILFVVVIFKLHTASKTTNFSKLSLLVKIIMIAGILSMALFYLEV